MNDTPINSTEAAAVATLADLKRHFAPDGLDEIDKLVADLVVLRHCESSGLGPGEAAQACCTVD